MNATNDWPQSGFLIRFQSLVRAGYALAFPSDERGQVEIDRLSEHARHNYFYARAMVGRDFEMPRVVDTHHAI